MRLFLFYIIVVGLITAWDIYIYYKHKRYQAFLSLIQAIDKATEQMDDELDPERVEKILSTRHKAKKHKHAKKTPNP